MEGPENEDMHFVFSFAKIFFLKAMYMKFLYADESEDLFYQLFLVNNIAALCSHFILFTLS